MFTVNCTWATWQSWSECSKTCGGGTHIKERTKSVVENMSGTCSGNPTQTGTCNIEQCPGTLQMTFNWIDT